MSLITLNQLNIPAIGFGTFQLKAENAYALTSTALENGYRHIDTAQIYDNETFVGDAILNAGIDRTDIFLTTKVWINAFTKNTLMDSVLLSLEKLKTNYVDLLLLHWPNENVDLSETIDALNMVYESGYAKFIGVSNFTIDQMEKACKISKAAITFNQIEYHPYLTQVKLVEKAKTLNINLMAHSPLGNGKIIQTPTIQTLAKKYCKDGAQIILRWLYQLNIPALVKSTHQSRIISNLDIFDFNITDGDMTKMNDLNKFSQRFINPKGLAPHWDE